MENDNYNNVSDGAELFIEFILKIPIYGSSYSIFTA